MRLNLKAHSIQWILVYVHSEVGGTKRGALKMFSEMYRRADKNRQNRILKIHIVQPSALVQMHMMYTKTTQKEVKPVFQKLHKHAR